MSVVTTTLPFYPPPTTMDSAVAAAVIHLLDLPDDNIAEILTRVPDAVSLFRCTVVCKRWRGIMSHAAFLRRCVGLCPAGGGWSSLLGFFVQRHLASASARSKVIRNTPSWAPVFVPVPGSALGPARRFLTSFLVPGKTRMLDDAKPLAGRDGLLLLRIHEKKTMLRLCVCDLLTGKHDLLPPIDDVAVFGHSNGATIGYAVLRTAAAAAIPGGHAPLAHGYSTIFRVLIVGVHHQERRVYIGEASSSARAPGEPVWAWSTEVASGGVLHGCLRAAAAVTGGAANWLLHATNGQSRRRLHILGVSVDDTASACWSTISLHAPLDYFSPWLCSNVDGDGKLSVLLVCDVHLSILTISKDEDDEAAGGSVGWRRSRVVHIAGAGGEMGLSGIEPVCVAEKSDAMLVLYRSDPDNAYLLDIHSGSTAMVAGGKRSLNYATAVPCEIDLVEFFMARLGVQAAAAHPGQPPAGLDVEERYGDVLQRH